ncbi:MAG: diaminopimelate decarboxylase [Thermosipho sp. (in: thermotogales)]|nr:diaminopimelate decarboxylase [Thermosipho sp. (in: thermotogales)]
MKEIFKEIAKRFGTPVYVYFEDILVKRAKIVKDVFSDLNYLPTVAIKANNNPYLLKILKDIGFGADILGEGEFYAASLAGIEPTNIVWNGNGKTPEQKEFMLKNNVKYINVDSIEEFEYLWKKENNFELFLRVNPDIDAKTHPYISTGLKKHKFGMTFDQARILLEKFRERISGFHIHIGSQITEISPFKEALEKTYSLAKEYNVKKINIGGGWGIKYKNENELDLNKLKEELMPILKNFELVISEIGRFIFAPSGFLLSKVLLVKKGEQKTFVVSESGMNHLIRPALYNAYHDIEVITESATKEVVDVVGPLCETGDFIAKDIEINLPEIGDLLIIKNAGAYGFSMANNYNGTTKPSEVLVKKDGTLKLIRKRQTIEELFNSCIID